MVSVEQINCVINTQNSQFSFDIIPFDGMIKIRRQDEPAIYAMLCSEWTFTDEKLLSFLQGNSLFDEIKPEPSGPARPDRRNYPNTHEGNCDYQYAMKAYMTYWHGKTDLFGVTRYP